MLPVHHTGELFPKPPVPVPFLPAKAEQIGPFGQVMYDAIRLEVAH